jgi:hypothetical protein
MYLLHLKKINLRREALGILDKISRGILFLHTRPYFSGTDKYGKVVKMIQ